MGFMGRLSTNLTRGLDHRFRPILESDAFPSIMQTFLHEAPIYIKNRLLAALSHQPSNALRSWQDPAGRWLETSHLAELCMRYSDLFAAHALTYLSG